MEKIAPAICALLAFLVPVGAYFLILASINRRSRPLVVSGLWDTIGLLFATSGFFLVSAPMMLTEFYNRSMGLALQDSVLSVWLRYWLVWVVYFLLLGSGAATVLLTRSRKTLIYNIDAELFAKGFEAALSALGLSGTQERGRMILAPAPPVTESVDNATAFTIATPSRPPGSDDPARRAELRVEAFPAMCHVTLHWEHPAPEFRREVESELEKALELAAPEDNPSAGWFLSISGLIFGALFMLVGMILVVLILPRS